MRKDHIYLKQTGFTLIELLVVIAVLSIIAVLVLIIFTRTLRGSNKSQIVLIVKQNGQAVLETIDKTLRNADSVTCVSKNPDNTIVVRSDTGVYTRYRFVIDASKATNGSILQDNPSPPPNTDINQFSGEVCNPLGQTYPMTNASVLTDTKPLTGVTVVSGSFKSQGLGNDVITIQFQLAPGVAAPAAVAGEIDPVTFQTTIGKR